jgi:hypothetical protein
LAAGIVEPRRQAAQRRDPWVRRGAEQRGLLDPGERFGEGLRIGLITWLIGAAAQTDA